MRECVWGKVRVNESVSEVGECLMGVWERRLVRLCVYENKLFSMPLRISAWLIMKMSFTNMPLIDARPFPSLCSVWWAGSGSNTWFQVDKMHRFVTLWGWRISYWILISSSLVFISKEQCIKHSGRWILILAFVTDYYFSLSGVWCVLRAIIYWKLTTIVIWDLNRNFGF